MAKLILNRLDRDFDAIRVDFTAEKEVPTHYTIIDDLLPDDIARNIADAFPPSGQLRYLNDMRERKYTSKALERFNQLISDITFAFQDQQVVDKVADLTGIRDAVGDPQLYAGGISAMNRGHFLNPHIDNSHDGEQRNYRVLNLLYYATPGWRAENGGNLELWDRQVMWPLEIPSLFNRLVLMATNDSSWHSVNEVLVDDTRRCISNYYFSPHSPSGRETSHVTYFMARPEQKVLRVITKVDSEIRTAIRKIKKSGFARADIYNGKVE